MFIPRLVDAKWTTAKWTTVRKGDVNHIIVDVHIRVSKIIKIQFVT